jgi:hypothetical protein
MGNELLQWALIIFLFVICLNQQMRLDAGAGKTADATPTSGKWRASIKRGRMRFDRTIDAATEADVIKVLLADGIDPTNIGEITRA